MKNHLLSIFPLRGFPGYARVYLTAIYETAIPSLIPFTTSREDLETLLRSTFLDKSSRHILAALDTDDPVQIAVDDDNAQIVVSTAQADRAYAQLRSA